MGPQRFFSFLNEIPRVGYFHWKIVFFGLGEVCIESFTFTWYLSALGEALLIMYALITSFETKQMLWRGIQDPLF